MQHDSHESQPSWSFTPADQLEFTPAADRELAPAPATVGGSGKAMDAFLSHKTIYIYYTIHRVNKINLRHVLDSLH